MTATARPGRPARRWPAPGDRPASPVPPRSRSTCIRSTRACLRLPVRPGRVTRLLLQRRPAQFNLTWQRLHHWTNWPNPCGAPEVVRRGRPTASRSASLATLIATVLGTLIAFALVRHRFRGRAADQPADLPADGDARDRAGRLAAGAVPQPAASSRGFWTILIAPRDVLHQLRRRHRQGALAGLDPRLEEAAMDLYADECRRSGGSPSRWSLPGIVAGGAARVRAVVRRLHHHQLQLRRHRHVPQVRLRVGPAGHSRPGTSSARPCSSSRCCLWVAPSCCAAAGWSDRVAPSGRMTT